MKYLVSYDDVERAFRIVGNKANAEDLASTAVFMSSTAVCIDVPGKCREHLGGGFIEVPTAVIEAMRNMGA